MGTHRPALCGLDTAEGGSVVPFARSPTDAKCIPCCGDGQVELAMPRWETWRPIQTSHPPGFRTAWCEAPSRPTWARLNGALLTTLGLYPRSVAVAEVWMPA